MFLFRVTGAKDYVSLRLYLLKGGDIGIDRGCEGGCQEFRLYLM